MISNFWKIIKTQSNHLVGFLGKLFDSMHIHSLIEEYEQVILTLFDHPILATALIDLDGNLIRGNHRFCELLGIDTCEGSPIKTAIHPENKLLDANLRQKLISGEMNSCFTEKQLISKDNEVVWVNLSASLVSLPVNASDRQRYFAVLLEDITENKKIYSALVRAEEKWKSFILNTPNLFIQTSSTGQIIYSSPSVKQILGYQEEELLDAHAWEFIHPDDLHRFELALRLWQSDAEYNRVGIECRWRSKSGLWVCIYLQGQRFPLSSEVDGLIIDGYNITDRKILEAELEDTEKKFNSLVLNIPGAVFQCDSTYTIQSINSEIYNITGYPAWELTDNRIRSYLSIIHPEDVDRVQRSAAQLKSERGISSIEYRIIHANGDIRWVCERKQRVFSANGQSWFDGVLLDISDRKRTEEDLCRSEAINRAMFLCAS